MGFDVAYAFVPPYDPFDELVDPTIAAQPRVAPHGRRGSLKLGFAASFGLLGALVLGRLSGICDTTQAPTPAVGEIANPPASIPALTPYDYSASLREQQDWAEFKRRFITVDGRVVDTSNGGVSHTEGQGWGMVLAVAQDDRATFALLAGWTRTHLSRSFDALHAWRYDPRRSEPVQDTNNATDGDLFIAGALARAARRWNEPAYRQQARLIAQSVLGLLVREVSGRTILLPGADNFEDETSIVLNPSYYVFPMLDELANILPSDVWSRLRSDGIDLIAEARFGRWKLPADWVLLELRDNAIKLAPGHPARFSSDAVRVPLYLAWAGVMSPAIVSLAKFWNSSERPPAWIDLRDGTTSSYLMPVGMDAVVALVTEIGREPPAHTARVDAARDYYSAALIMLANLARRETVA